MTTAGHAGTDGPSPRLYDVSQPEQPGGHDDQRDSVRGEYQHRMLRCDRGRYGPPERRRGEALGQRGCVLSHEEVADPPVRAAVDAVDETDGDELNGKQVDEAGAQRGRGLTDHHTEPEPDGPLSHEDEPDRAEALCDVDRRRPADGGALERGDVDAQRRADDEEDTGNERPPGEEDA